MTTSPEAHFRATAPRYMRQMLEDVPAWGRDDVAACFGNLGHESLGFTLLQEQKPTVAGSKGGFGWAQWTGPRRRAFEAFCAAHGLKPVSEDANYAFLLVELEGAYAGTIAKVKAAKTLAAKVKAFELSYEGARVKAYASRNRWAAVALEALDSSPLPPVQEDRPVGGPVPTEPHQAPTVPEHNTVLTVQEQLWALGYTEVGKRDGDLGPMTEAAILAFRKDNGLPLTPTIDDELLAAIAKAPPRKLAPERENASPKEVRQEVPEAKAGFFAQIWAAVLGIPAAIGAIVQPALDAIPGAKKGLQPLVDVAGDVPGWTWCLAIAGVALVIAYYGLKVGQHSAAAFRTGERR